MQMRRLPLPRKLFIRLAASVVTAFVLAMGVTWAVHCWLADEDAYKLMNRVLDDVKGEIEEQVNRRLVLAAMVARDRLSELPDQSVAALRALADELHVDEVCVVDPKGILVASARAEDVGLDFHKLGGQAAEFLPLLDEITEYAQRLMPSSLTGQMSKYVGVWRPEGGFVQVGCLQQSLSHLAQSAITGLTHHRHVGGVGTIIITTPQGQIISDAANTGREGSVMSEPGDDTYCLACTVEGFPVYALLPKSAAAVERNVLVGTSALLTISSLVFVAILVGLAIAGYVREQMRSQIAAEMETAKGIQSSALPSVFPPYPHELRMDVFARMDTANEVGGDFYDFYFVGPGRIAYLVADVSGKGVPAAMFMMKAKTIIKGCVTSMANFSDAMTEANARLFEDNEAGMFVTCWIGVLDLKTGVLEYVNCGHNPPYLLRKGGGLEPLKDVSGLFLGAMDDVRYRRFEVRMNPGDRLFLYTDGVTEATNSERHMFGEERLEKALAEGPYNPVELCGSLKRTVDAFAGAEPQFDDITMLALVYRGNPEAVSKTFPAKREMLPEVSGFVEGRLEACGCPDSVRSSLLIAVDEIGSNIASYSGSPEMDVTFELAANPPVVRLTFADSGTPWDPLAHPDPDVSLAAEDRKIGGLGILVVKKLMDDVRYERRGGKNVLLLRKNLPWSSEAAV